MSNKLVLAALAVLVFGPLAAEEPAAHGTRTAKLITALTGSDRVVIEPIQFGDNAAKTFEIKSADKMKALIASIEIDDANSGFHCMCDGDTLFTFYKADGVTGKLGYHHGRSLRWQGGPWKGDGLLTGKSALAIPKWFKDNGYAALQEARDAEIAEQRKQEEEDQLFVSFFPENLRKFALGKNNGMVRAGGKSEVQPSKLADAMTDKKALAVACCKALGSADGSWSTSTAKDQAALGAMQHVNAATFQTAIEEIGADKFGLLGAARIYFFEEMGGKIKEPARTDYAVLLGEAALNNSGDENKPRVLRTLATLNTEKSVALLERVTSGQTGKEIDLSKAYGQEPGLRSGATLALAQTGRGDKEKIKLKLQEAKFPADRAAYEVSLALLGEGEPKNEWFKLRSYSIGYAGLKVIEQRKTKAALDMLVDGAFEHPWAAINQEAVLIFERITGQNWYQGQKWENPLRYRDNAKAWWKENREKYAPQNKVK